MGSLKRAPVRICPVLRIFSFINFQRRKHRKDRVDRKISRRDGRAEKFMASRLRNLFTIITHKPAHFLISGINLAYPFGAFKFCLSNIKGYYLAYLWDRSSGSRSRKWRIRPR